MTTLSIFYSQQLSTKRKKSIHEARLKNLLSRMQKLFPYVDLKVELKLTESSEIKKLNAEFRSKNKATDVLSFPMNSDLLLGVIAIDLVTAEKQALDYRHSLQDEAEQLFVHGVLHLLGFDHHKANEAELMRQYEVFFCPQP